MRKIAVFLILALCAGAYAGGGRSGLTQDLRSGAYPALGYFLNGIGGPEGPQAAAFAGVLPEDGAARADMLRRLDMLLRGGNYDKRGDNIRREMAKLPGEQWQFVVILERERRAIYDRLGYGPTGNLYESVTPAKIEPRRCYERMDALIKKMAPVQAAGAFRAWKTEELTANMITVSHSRGLRDELYGGVHNAPCFVYDDGRARVEIAADAWANSLTPAYTWWYQFDRATHDQLYRAGGRDWCSDEAQRKAVNAQVEARRAAERKAAPAAPPKSSTLDGLQGAAPF
jgi:hypothetical protein